LRLGTGLLLALGVLAVVVSRAPVAAAPTGASTDLRGRLLLRPVMLVPREALPRVLSIRDRLIADGLAVARDGSVVLWPPVPAAGYIVEVNGQKVFTDADGGFSVAAAGDAAATAVVRHPTDASFTTTFPAARLQASPPRTLVWPTPFNPMGMNRRAVTAQRSDGRAASCCRDRGVPALALRDGLVGDLLQSARLVRLAQGGKWTPQPTSVTRGARGTYPVGKISCEDANGVLEGALKPSAMGGYAQDVLFLGST